VAVNLLRRRSRPISGENWAQFELFDPEIEAATRASWKHPAGSSTAVTCMVRRMFTSGAREPSRPSDRTSYPIVISAVAVGREMRAARHALRATYTDLHPRVMPISRLLGLVNRQGSRTIHLRA
jgi:hypothetical protein